MIANAVLARMCFLLHMIQLHLVADPGSVTGLQRFYNSQAYMKCASARIPVQFNAEVDINNDGWDTTLDLISQQARQGAVSTYSIQP